MVRLFLGANALLFLGFGVYMLLNPQAHSAIAGTIAANVSADALYEIRSNYGGVSLGVGLLCLVACFRRDVQRPALYCLLAYTGGYALGRLLALPFDGVPSVALIGYAIYEFVTAAIALIFIRSLHAAKDVVETRGRTES